MSAPKEMLFHQADKRHERSQHTHPSTQTDFATPMFEQRYMATYLAITREQCISPQVTTSAQPEHLEQTYTVSTTTSAVCVGQ